MEIKILELVYTITNTKKLNKAYETPQKRVLVKWNTSKNINTYMKADFFQEKDKQCKKYMGHGEKVYRIYN